MRYSVLNLCCGTLLMCVRAEDLTKPKPGNCQLDAPCEGKGECIQKENEYLCSCYHPYYESDDYDCKEINHCKKSPCTNKGSCIPIWGNYFCECPTNFYGRNCELANSAKISRISTPLVLFNLEATELNYTTVFIIFDGDIGTNFSFSLDVYESCSLVLESQKLVEAVPAEVAQRTDLWSIPALTPKFATVKKKLFYYTYFYPKQVEEEKPEVLRVEVKNGGVIQFAGNYTSNVTAPELWCVPDVTLYDCGETRSTAAKIKRNTKIIVRSEVDNECSGSELTTSWRYYALTEEQPFPFPFSYSDMDQGKNRVVLDKFSGQTYLEIEAHTLNYGDYIIELYVTEVPIKPSTKISHFNIVWGWIRIVPAHLVAYIKNGTEITVAKGTAITLDASESHDPNEINDSNKDHLLFSWTCESTAGMICQKINFTGNVINIDRNLVNIGVYAFSVNVSVDPKWAAATGKPSSIVPGPASFTQTVVVVDDTITHLGIHCMKNCGRESVVNIRDTIYLKAFCLRGCSGSEGRSFYRWTVLPKIDLNLETTQFGSRSNKLITHPNLLKADENYRFTVSGGFHGMATFALSTPPPLLLSNGTCELNPQTGITGVTKFNLTCHEFPLTQDGFSLQYELYQTNDPEYYDAGVLISYSFHPSRHNVVLMAGKPNFGYKVYLSFCVIDQYGVPHILQGIVSAEVKSFDENVEDHVEKFIGGPEGDLLEYLQISGKIPAIVERISASVSAFDSTTAKDIKREEGFRDLFIEVIAKIPLTSSPAILQSLSVLNLVLGHNETARISHNGIRNAAMILQDIVEKMYEELVKPIPGVNFATADVEYFFQKVMDSSDTIIATTEKMMKKFPFPPEEPTTMAELKNKITGIDYPDYTDVNFVYVMTQEHLHLASASVARSIRFMGQIATTYLKEEEKGMEIVSKNTTSFVKVEKPTALAGHLIPADATDGLLISTDMAEAIQDKYEYLEVHVALSSRNPFAWDPKSKDMNANLLIVHMRDQLTKEPINIKEFKEPLDMFLSLKDPTFLASSSHNMTASSVSVPLGSIYIDDILEQHMSVHKIEGRRGSKPYLVFQNPPYKLMVVVAAGLRPSVADFSKYSEHIPHDVPPGVPSQESLVVHVQNTEGSSTTGENELFYIAILPEFETMEKEAVIQGEEATLVVHYAFELFLISCPMWDAETMRWNTEECEAGVKTSRGTLHCQCHHLSSFVGSVVAKPYENDPLKLVKVDLKAETSIVVLVAVLILYAIFLLLFMWSRQKDKDDIPGRALTILKDNIPEYRYPYLVIVFTAPKWNAGTTANVFIEIVGANSKSEIHHLIDPRRKQTHTAGSDNWFAVHTYRWLGPLLYINLWHDNTGKSPSWYCEKILVHDARRDQVWTFIAERWLSVTRDDGSICCTLTPAPKKEIEKYSSLFKEHFVMCLREDHYYLNALLRHPRSTYTRTQRLAVTFFMTLGGLMAAIWELGIPNVRDPGTQIQEIEPDFISIPHIFHSLQNDIPIMAICFALVLLFRKTAPREVDAMYKHGEKYEAILEEYKAMEKRDRLSSLLREKGVTGARNSVTKQDDHAPAKEISKEQTQSKLTYEMFSTIQDERSQENEFPSRVLSIKLQTGDESSTVTSAAQVTEKIQKRSQILLRILDVIMLTPFILSGLRIYSGQAKKTKKHFRLIQVRPDTFETSYYWFTHWALYIIWSAWLLIMAGFTHMLLYYGSLLGHVKSMEWIKAVIVSLVFGACCFQTFKVLVFSVVLTVFFRTHAKPSQLHSGVWWDETDYLHRMVLVETRLTRAHYKPMYEAVSPEVIQAMREKQKIRMELMWLVIDIVMFFVYIATLYYIVLSTRDSLAYYSTKTLEDHVIVPDRFYAIQNQNDFINYLYSTLIPSVHCEKLYNGDAIEREGVVSNYESRLLGIIRIRQLRVKADCIPAPEISNVYDGCTFEYSTENEDRNNYGIGWKPFNEKTFRETRVRTPWLYRTPSESGTTAIEGQLQIYPGGGYFTTLGRTLNNSIAILNFLMDSSWFDRFTRVVFLEFSIYNVNRNLFNIVTIIAEIPTTGAVLISYSVTTEKLLITTGLLSIQMIVIIAVWTVVFCLFFGIQLIRAWKESVIEYFMTPWNLIDLAIIALGVAMIVMNIIRNSHVSQLIRHLETVNGNDFVDFTWVGVWQMQLNCVMAALVALSTVRLWRLLRFGTQFKVVEMTLLSSAKCLMSLAFMMSILLLGFAALAYIFTGYKLFQFSSFELSFFYLLLYGFGFFHIRTVDIEEENSLVGRTFLLLYWLLYVIYLVNMFITVIIIYYENSKKYMSLKRTTLDIKSFILEEIIQIFAQKDEDDEKYDSYNKDKSLKKTSLNTDSKPISQNSIKEGDSEDLSDKRYLIQVVYTAVPKPSPVFLNRTQNIPVINIKGMKALIQNYADFGKERLQIIKPIVANELVEDYKWRIPLYIEYFHCGFEKNELQFVPDARLKEMEMLINVTSDENMTQVQDYAAIIKATLDEGAVNLKHIENQLDKILALLNLWKIRSHYYKQDIGPKKQDSKEIPKKSDTLPTPAQTTDEINKQDILPKKQDSKEINKKDEIHYPKPFQTKSDSTIERITKPPKTVRRGNALAKINLFLNKDIKAKIFLSSPNVKKQEGGVTDLARKDISHPASVDSYPTVCPCSLCEIATKGIDHETL